MTSIFGRLPLAWLQLSHQKVRLVVALLGVAFANLLMFIQLGLRDSLMESTSAIEERLTGDLFLIDERSKALIVSQPFSRRLLQLALSLEGVASVAPVHAALGNWRNPWTGSTRSILALGFDPERLVLAVPEVQQQREALRGGDTVLFDTTSRPEFGPVAEAVQRRERVVAKLEDQRLRVGGLFTLGASFAADGNLVTGEATFQRIFAGRGPGAVDMGVVQVRPGADVAAVQRGLRAYLPPNLRVLTKPEIIAWEQEYWGAGTTIGFIFNQGVVIGFIVGVVIVYQILYTDVANHLAEYATLKAIGYTNRYLLGVVFQEAALLSVLGYVPGVLASTALYALTAGATGIDVRMTWGRAALVLALTLAMCFASGALAVRKLRSADPAEVF